MSIKRELLVHALDRLKHINFEDDHLTNDLIQTIQKYLAQPEQEPTTRHALDSYWNQEAYQRGYAEAELKLKREQEPVTDKPTETAMAVMPNGVCVSNVYDAYEEGRKSVTSEQQPEAWIIVNKETGYRTQVSDLTPFLYHKEIFEVIPLYTAPPVKSEQEHVGIVRTIGGYPDNSEHVVDWVCKYRDLKEGDRLYLAPPKRERITDEEIYNRCCAMDNSYTCNFIDGVEWAEEHHGIGGGE